ncbi:MAG: hypothetical protein K2X07_13820 [Caulobacteraceae bacterium]|nr:hypothetical protein [Caulobacteraceae bacterium]
MSFRLLTAASALVMTLSAAAAHAQDFRALAVQDLTKAEEEIRQNHPALTTQGVSNDAFRNWLNTGLAQAQSFAPRVNSGDSHAYLMRYYANGFRDPSVRIDPTFDLLGPYFATSWAGVTTGWRDGKYVVTHVQPGTRRAPPVGAVVMECNGMPIEEFAQQKLDLWEGDLTTEAGRVYSAPYLLWNRNNPFTRGVPQTCKFQPNGRGRGRDFELQIQPVSPPAMEAAYRATVFMPGAQPLAIEDVNGRPWVRVNTLADEADWRGFNAQLEGAVETLRGPNGFVLDLRAASQDEYTSLRRAYGVANRIWSPEYTVSRQPAAESITYRATADNRAWFAETLARMEGDAAFAAENPAVIEETRAVVAAFDAALAAGQDTFSLQGRPAPADTGAANPVQGPVVVLVDQGCAGACLDLLDLLVQLPNVRIVGTPTSGGSIFVEPTLLRLPSNYADLEYGHKAWTGRARGHLEPVTPSVAYTGNPADENAVKTWVATLF